jgi:hypothetical protein
LFEVSFFADLLIHRLYLTNNTYLAQHRVLDLSVIYENLLATTGKVNFDVLAPWPDEYHIPGLKPILDPSQLAAMKVIINIISFKIDEST